MSQPTPSGPNDRDAKLICSFLHELNVARRNLSLYPPGHPQLRDAQLKTLQPLQHLCELRPQLSLGVGPDSFFFEGRCLGKGGPGVHELARLLSALGVASLEFRRGLGSDELNRFCQLISAERQALESAGGFAEVLPRQRIEHIQVTPIDYSAFKGRAGGIGPAAQTPLWGDFLQGLFEDHLDTGTSTTGTIDPALLADALRERAAGGAPPLPELTEAIARLTREPAPAQLSSAGAKLAGLLGELTPELQRSVIDSILQSLDKASDQAAEPLLAELPNTLLQKTLPAAAESGISSRLVALVKRLAKNTDDRTQQRVQGPSAPLEEDMLRARLDVLFREEQQDSYLPGEYQRALLSIIDDDLSDILPAAEQAQLRQSLEQQSVERQCGAVICELLDQPLDDQNEAALQDNLVELSRFLLDTGDFRALQDIHDSWSRFLNRRAETGLFAERLLATHTQPSFITEVLDSVELWGKEKQAEIGDYLVAVGEAYAEALIIRLGAEKKLTLRRYWMSLLERIGRPAQPALIAALDDSRWYLVRNLLVLLGRQPDVAVVKAIQPLATHPHPRVRQELLKILLRCNPAAANRLLLKELSSDDPHELHGAVQVAEHSRDPAILARLHLLLSKAGEDQDTALARPLLQTLARIGNAESLPLLTRLLDKRSLLPSRRLAQLHTEILRALGDFPRPLSEPLLRQIARGRQRQQANLADELLRQLTGGAP